MMRFLDLTVRNFRGFGPAVETVKFGGDLVLFFGPNGFGKTSVSEAVEWLLYGSTKRRKRGELYSRAEYAGSYANVHGAAPVEVVATVQIGTATKTIERRLGPNETSSTYIDGVEAPLSSLGLQPIEAIYPIIAQHGLQTFILSKPKDRRDAISAALGLDELTAFKSALEGARSSFQRTPPAAVISARKELNLLSVGLLTVVESNEVGKRWQKQPAEVDPVEDERALLEAARALADSRKIETADVLADLRVRREVVSKAVFDLQSLRPADDKTVRRRSTVARALRLDRLLADLKRETTGYLSSIATGYGAALLDFWITGLELSPEGDICPMCESPTMHAEHRRLLRDRIAKGKEPLEARKRLSHLLGRIAILHAQLTQDLKVENCLGLSTYLMRACSPGSPFGFIMLDDPVQSMDDGHAESFISDIVPHLLDDHGKQVIVLSHTKKVIERLRQLNQHRATRVYHFDNYERGGPTLTEQVGLAILAAEIRGGMAGNSDNRMYAIDRIRVLAEHFIRELYVKVEGRPTPTNLDNASAKDLLPLFRNITGTTQQEFVGLRDTISFADPAHHTQVGYAVPVRSNIQPHLDRLEGMISKYGL